MALVNDLRERGVLSGYEKYVMEMEPILQAMGKRGMPVLPASHAEVKADLELRYAEAEKAMQAFIPDDVRACSPKFGYKKEPKDTTGLSKRWFTVDGGDGKEFGVKVERWCRLEPWKPSRDGLIRYMAFKRHPIPTDYKTGKQTTTEIELNRLARKTRDFLYDAVLEYRQIGTVLNNHIANWEPGPDGRVHPTFYYETGTGQLASRRPNVQNAPKHGQDAKKALADKFRSMVQAAPGHTLLSFDYRSFHAQTLAFEANDPDYLRLAKLDIHSYLTAHLVREPDRERLLAMRDDDLARRLSEIKAKHSFVRDYKAKRAILGYGFGMGWRKLYMMNREAFDSQADAKRTVDMLNAVFPRAAKWRDTIRQQAHEQGFLVSRFGCIRYFWEVFKWSNGKWEQGGEDSEAAIAFLPANDAFCPLKNGLREMEQRGLLEKYRLINSIHDDNLFECPDTFVEECIKTIAGIMERPSDVLVSSIVPNGLTVEVGIHAGKHWHEMEAVKRVPSV